MARTTRSKGASATGSSTKTTTVTATASTVSRYALSEESENPPKLFILPRRATEASRVVTLQNPRYLTPTRYLICPRSGIYEFTQIASPRSAPRSWLVETAKGKLVTGGTEADAPSSIPDFDTHILQDADLYVASPIDPLFLALPALFVTRSSKSSDGPKRMFLSVDDHFDAITEKSNSLSEILRWPAVRKLLEFRMSVVCDTVEAGDEKMFRLNEAKLIGEILSKAKNMSERGLPKSMEEKFVTKPLAAPFLATKSLPDSGTIAHQAASLPTDDSVATPQTESTESQLSASGESLEDSTSKASMAATSVTDESTPVASEEVSVAMTASEEVVELQRLKVAFNFICSSYIAPSFEGPLKENLATQATSVNFGPLEDYLGRLAKQRQEAIATRSMTDYSRKRTLDEADDERMEKKRKKEEEERRKKAGESRGVKELKKVNVSGMKKLSAFFKKK